VGGSRLVYSVDCGTDARIMEFKALTINHQVRAEAAPLIVFPDLGLAAKLGTENLPDQVFDFVFHSWDVLLCDLSIRKAVLNVQVNCAFRWGAGKSFGEGERPGGGYGKIRHLLATLSQQERSGPSLTYYSGSVVGL
jgi:hypothetical protein